MLDFNQKLKILQAEQGRTKDDAIDKLNKYGKVMIVRPTGFGKTRTIVELGKEYANKYKDKKIAYIYPLDIIKVEITTKEEYMRDNIIKNKFEFISYSKLTLDLNTHGDEYWKDYFSNKFSLIILDEVHSAGSEGFQKLYKTIKDMIKPDGLHMLGATATPNRMDDSEDFNVTSGIFDDIQVYEYNVADCIRDGLIPKIVMPVPLYDLKNLAESLKETTKRKCKRDELEFDERSFNVEIGKLLKGSGTEGEYIYNALPDAGYDLKNPSHNYFKFIVFFNDTLDMADKGPEVEKWFDDAFNLYAKNKLGIRRRFDIRSYYILSNTNNEDIVRTISSNPDKRKAFNQTKKVETIKKQDNTVDLLFTINKINMGYHVEGITGIMMLRGTRSEVVYYQQLGRALSVNAKFNPIVYDMVNNVNEKFWSKKNRLRTIEKQFIDAVSSDREVKDYSGIELIKTGCLDSFDAFLERWQDPAYSQNSKIKYLYVERQAPICLIAKDINKSCSYVAKQLIKMDVELVPEDNMYRFLNEDIKSENTSKDIKKDRIRLLRYLYSKKAKDELVKMRGVEVKRFLYDIVKKLQSGGN